MRKNKMRFSKDDYRRYNVDVPFYQSPFVYALFFALILVIDAIMLYNNIDLAFSNISKRMGYITTVSACIIIDIIPLVVCDALKLSPKGKRALPWIAVIMIGIAILLLLFQRILSSDTMFSSDTIDSSLLSSGEEDTGAKPYQIAINVFLGIAPLITTIFGLIYTFRRNRIRKYMRLAENKIELDTLINQKCEIESSDGLNKAIATDEVMYSLECDRVEQLRQVMLIEKNDMLAKALKDPRAISRISSLNNTASNTKVVPLNAAVPAISSAVNQIPLTQAGYPTP